MLTLERKPPNLVDNGGSAWLGFANTPRQAIRFPRSHLGGSYSVASTLVRSLGTTPPSKLAAPSLPEGVPGVSAIPFEWFAVHSRIDGGSRDAAVAWALFLAELPFYYPVAEVQVWEGLGEKRRKRKKRVSLFDGYLFGAGPECRKFCRENPDLIESVIPEPRAGQLRGELLIVETGLRQDPRMKTRDVGVPGIRVRVTRGPYLGMEGTVESWDKDNGAESKLWVRLPMMGREVPISVDTSDLERI